MAVEVVEIRCYNSNRVHVGFVLFALAGVEAVISQSGRTALPCSSGFFQDLATASLADDTPPS